MKRLYLIAQRAAACVIPLFERGVGVCLNAD